MTRLSTLSTLALLTVSMVLVGPGPATAQDPALVLGQGGIRFPDDTVQATAAVGDGVKVIDQDCATGAGCFAGDDPGFPVEITSPGSYRLASNLDLRGEPMAADLGAIDIASGNVTVDLNGFVILGPNHCAGTPPTSCSANGTGVGIKTNGNRISVRNGGIQGMGDHGIRGVSNLWVEGVRVEDCGGNGIDASGGIGGVLRNNSIRRNGGNGIDVGPHHMVMDNLIHANIGTGLVLGNFSAYGGNVINQNGATVTGTNLVQLGDNACQASTCP